MLYLFWWIIVARYYFSRYRIYKIFALLKNIKNRNIRIPALLKLQQNSTALLRQKRISLYFIHLNLFQDFIWKKAPGWFWSQVLGNLALWWVLVAQISVADLCRAFFLLVSLPGELRLREFCCRAFSSFSWEVLPCPELSDHWRQRSNRPETHSRWRHQPASSHTSSSSQPRSRH